RRRKRGVAAHEDEDERVVAPRDGLLAGKRPRGGYVLPAAAGVVAAVLLGHTTGGHTDEPGQGVVGFSVGGPGGGGGEERLLHRVLGVGEVAVAAYHGTEDPRRQLTQEALGARGSDHTSGSGALSTWRTSMGWPMGTPSGPGAADARAAISRARSRVSTSTRRKPASSSLASGKGPSVMTGALAPSDTTNLACSGPAGPGASTSSPRSRSSWFRAFWNSMWALMSPGVHSVMGAQPDSTSP